MKSYKGVNYLIKQHPNMFFWLAYIKLPKGHKWEKKRGYDNIPLKVHGGLTFMSKVTEKNKKDYWQNFSIGTWIGWDYGHAGDFTDYGFAFHPNPIFQNDLGAKRWEYEEVEKEVKDAIKQVLN